MSSASLRRLPTSSLLFDPNNPRLAALPGYLPVDDASLSHPDVQAQTRWSLLGDGGGRVADLLTSLRHNGWLPVEPLHVRPLRDDKYVILDGNRRLAALSYLEHWSRTQPQQLSLPLSHPPDLPRELDCLVELDLPLPKARLIAGLRHITGPQRWPALSQANLVRTLAEDDHIEPHALRETLGLQPHETQRFIQALALAEAYRSSEHGEQLTPEKFDLFVATLATPELRRWLGWDDKARQARHPRNQERLFTWMSHAPVVEFDPGAEAPPFEPVIQTRHQLRELARLVEQPRLLDDLAATRNLTQTLARATRAGTVQEVRNAAQTGSMAGAAAIAVGLLANTYGLHHRPEWQRTARTMLGFLPNPSEQRSDQPWPTRRSNGSRPVFDHLHIKRFRGLEHLRLDDLAPINLIVGINNAGKTSLLEAIHLLIAQNDPRGLLSTMQRRARHEPPPAWIVEQWPVPAELEASLHLNNLPMTTQLSLDALQEPAQADSNRATWLGTLRLQALWSPTSPNPAPEAPTRHTTLADLHADQAHWSQLAEGDAMWICPSMFSSPFTLADPATLTRANEASVAVGTKDRIVTFIREHVDPDVENIELVDEHHRFLVSHRRFERSPDLAAFGDGMQRVFQIGLMFAAARGGVILIDEFENALHTALIPRFIELIHALAQEFNTQLFLTTHSKETVDAFVQLPEITPDVAAYSMSRHDGRIQARRYDGHALKRALDAVNLDIRRL